MDTGRERGVKRDDITEGISYYKTADITHSSTATCSDLVLFFSFREAVANNKFEKKLVGLLLISSSVIVSCLSVVSCHHPLCVFTSVMRSVEAAEPRSRHTANSGH